MEYQQDFEFESILEAYPVRLDKFEGPLDLLLHLIKQHQVDIYDIPIAAITEQYLGYIDMMMEDDGRDRVRAAYRGNYDRLVQVKRRYDPTNLFHINHNIPPRV